MAVPTLTANSPSAGFIAWTAFNISYNGVGYPVAAGNTNNIYTVWLYNNGSPQMAFTNTAPIQSGTSDGTPGAGWAATPIVGPDDLLLFVNKNGVPINVQYSDIVDGDIIATGTITSAQIATGTITANNIQGGTITSTQIASGTIAASNIAAGVIGTNLLAAGAVTADKIGAGAVTTDKLTVGSLGDNLVVNPGFEDASTANPSMPSAWTFSYESAGTPTGAWAVNNGNHYVNVTNSATNGGAWGSQAFPVQAGQTYSVQVQVQASTTTNNNIYARLFFGTTSSMNRTTGLVTTTPAFPSPNPAQMLDLSTGLTYAPTTELQPGYAGIAAGVTMPTTNVFIVSGQVIAPANATWAQLALYSWASGSGSTVVSFDNAKVMPVIISARIANGAITANQIAANTITANQIAAGAITSNQIAAGAVVANSIAAGAINGMTITGANIRTAASGQRVELSSTNADAISFYTGDASEAQPAVIYTSIVSGQDLTTSYGGAQPIAGNFGARPFIQLVTAISSLMTDRCQINFSMFDQNNSVTSTLMQITPSEVSFFNNANFDTSGNLNAATVHVFGSLASYYFDDRTGSSPGQWAWYAQNGFCRLWNNSTGDTIAVTPTLFRPWPNQSVSLGASGAVWNGIWTNPNLTTTSAANAVIGSTDGHIVRSTSSMKYKTNIKDVTFPDEWLDHMRPVTFNSTSDYDDPDQTIVGLIAEDMHNATDQHRLFVDYVDGEPDAIGYDRLVVPLISIVRDLRDRIIALENRG